MVADKVITALSGGICPDDDITMIEAPCVKSVDNFDGAKIQDVDTNLKESEEHPPESSLDNFCEVVVTYRCKFCSFVANDRTEFKSHVSSTHAPGNAEEKVASNGKSELDLNSDLPQPVQGQNETSKTEGEKDEVFFCSECSVIFSSADLCYNHMVEVHNLQAFSTDLIRENPLSSQPTSAEPKRKRIRCSKQPVENSNGKREKPATNGEHMCKLCKTKFTSLTTVQTHERCHIASVESTQMGPNPPKKPKNNVKTYVKGYVCCYCEPEKTGKFLTWGKCAFHLWKEHEIDCDLYTCSVCKYKTPTLAKLKDHELLHSSEAKFTCSTCRKSFKQFKQLKTHEKYHKTNNTKLPPPNEARWYTPKECPVCNRILSDSKCLKKHIRAVHNKMKPYVCNICGHTSARKAELKLHVRQHTGEKPYKCPVCPFSTGDHNSLRKHKRRHADSRPYECPHCDYSAIQSHAFKKHVLAVHASQDVVFVCPSCPLVTVSEKIFEAHRKDHEDGRIPTGPRNVDSPKSTDQPNGPVDDSTQASSSSIESADKASKFWLRDEDSIEIVDTGGITIPAAETDKEESDRPAATLPKSSRVSKETHPFLPDASPFGGSITSSEPVSMPAETSGKPTAVSCPDQQTNCSDKEGNRSQEPPESGTSFGNMDESRAVSIVAELLAEGDSNTLNQFLLDPLLNDSIDLPDILCNDHSNDGTLEKLLNMNVTGFS